MTKPKKKLHDDLNKVLDFYERQADFVGGGAYGPCAVLHA